MDPIVTGGLLKIGGSLLGGLFGKKKTVSARVNSRDAILGQAEGARKASEEYGFNPLTLLGASSAVGPSQSDNTMGQAIADAALLAADSLTGREEDKLRIENMRLQNERLKAEVTNLTLRPKVGGIYASNVTTPSLGAVGGGSSNASVSRKGVGVGNGAGVSDAGALGSGWFPRPLGSSHWADDRREVDNQPVTSSSGFMVVDNPNLPVELVVPTLDGDEPLHWYEYPDLIVPAAIGGLREAYKYGSRLGARKYARERGSYAFSSDGFGYALQAPKPKPKPKDRRPLFQRLGNPFPNY